MVSLCLALTFQAVEIQLEFRDQEDIARAVTAFAEDGSELDPEKLHIAQKLLKYYHFCTKASLRQGGFDDAFKLSPDIIELPANFGKRLKFQKVIRIRL